MDGRGRTDRSDEHCEISRRKRARVLQHRTHRARRGIHQLRDTPHTRDTVVCTVYGSRTAVVRLLQSRSSNTKAVQKDKKKRRVPGSSRALPRPDVSPADVLSHYSTYYILDDTRPSRSCHSVHPRFQARPRLGPSGVTSTVLHTV